MRFPSALTTVEAVARQLQKASPGTTPSPELSQYLDFYAYLADLVIQVSDYITGQCDRSFVPYREDKILYFADMWDGTYDRRRGFLWLPDDLIAVNTLTWDTTTLSATDYRLQNTDSVTAWGILFNPSSSLSWSSDFNAGLTVSGIWGCIDTLNQWSTVDSSVTIADTTTVTVTVAASSAYEIWQYLRCESEYMQVTNKPSATTLTVLRGVNGTTAAAHAAKPLQTFMPVADIRMAATRLAAFFYEKRLDVGGAVQIGDSAFLLDSLPVVVKEAIKARTKLSWGHV